MRPNEPVGSGIAPRGSNKSLLRQGKTSRDCGYTTPSAAFITRSFVTMNSKNEWMVHPTKKAKEGSQVGLAFEPEDKSM